LKFNYQEEFFITFIRKDLFDYALEIRAETKLPLENKNNLRFILEFIDEKDR
jgi:hypothetical protein